MRLHISLSEEDNLVSLKNIAPNFDFQYFRGNPIMHESVFRNINEDMRPPKKGRKKKNKKRRRTQDSSPSNQPLAEVHPKYVTEVEHGQTINGERSSNY